MARRIASSGQGSAEVFIPPHPTLESLKGAAAGCRACPLWERGTQTVFGEGRRHARMFLVGEQPGDSEDRQGRPFVGAAGRLLALALERAGIDRESVYITNAVKHFKWVQRGKRRIHQKPNALEVTACRPWLMSELALVAPRVVVCLGATAAWSLLGPDVRVNRDRGKLLQSTLAPLVFVTVHPSSILRSPDEKRRHEELERFVQDLRAAFLSSIHRGNEAPIPGVP